MLLFFWLDCVFALTLNRALRMCTTRSEIPNVSYAPDNMRHFIRINYDISYNDESRHIVRVEKTCNNTIRRGTFMNQMLSTHTVYMGKNAKYFISLRCFLSLFFHTPVLFLVSGPCNSHKFRFHRHTLFQKQRKKIKVAQNEEKKIDHHLLRNLIFLLMFIYLNSVFFVTSSV